MTIAIVEPLENHKLRIVSEDGREGIFDVSNYLGYEAFQPLRDLVEFSKVLNGGYFVEWECGADLSADTIEAHLQVRDAASGRKAV